MKKITILFVTIVLTIVACEKTYYVEEAPIALADAVLGDDQLTIPKGFDFSSSKSGSLDISLEGAPSDASVKVKVHQVFEGSENLIHDGYFNADQGLNKSIELPNHINTIKLEATYMGATVTKLLTNFNSNSLRFSIREFEQEIVDPEDPSDESDLSDRMLSNTPPTITCPSSPDAILTGSGTKATTSKNEVFAVSGTFTGSIEVDDDGLDIYVCDGTTFAPSSISGGKLDKMTVYVDETGNFDLSSITDIDFEIQNTGTLYSTQTASVTVFDDKGFDNWGTVDFDGNVQIDDKIENFMGTLNIDGDVTINAELKNDGRDNGGATLSIGGNVTNNYKLKNEEDSTLSISGNLTNTADVTELKLKCKATIGGNFDNAGKLNMDKPNISLVIGGDWINTDGSEIKIDDDNVFVKSQNLISYEDIEFDDEDNVLQTGVITLHNDKDIKGDVDVFSDNFNPSSMGADGANADNDTDISTSTCSIGFDSAAAFDADSDGVADGSDVEPNNGDVATYNYPQGQGSYYTSVFEDLWPCKGDFDFNDLVTLYTFREGVSASSEVKELQFTLKIAAIGAANDNGFSLRVMGNATMNNESLDGVEYNRYYDSTNGTTVFTFTKFKAALSRVETSVINTVTSDFAEDDYLEISGKITSIDNGYDFFLTTDSDTAQELHPLSGNVGTAAALTKPTDRMDTSLMNTCWDTSNTTGTGYDHTGQYFLDADGMAWGMIIPTPWAWPKEKNSIISTYTNLEDYVESNKASSTNWYLDTEANRGDGSKVFRH